MSDTNETSGTAVSIFGQAQGTNDFPVLKAFQEYIDAEQAKARKRMLGLSVFFIILLVVVVVTFVLVLTTVVNRNQALSDRLLDYALKEREKQIVQPPVQPVVQQAAPQPSVQDVLKPFIERLEREQAAMKAMYEKQQKDAEAKYEMQRKEAEAKAAARELARDEEIRKAKLELEKERARAKKENDRQAEIERQRRRLYPDYYRMQPESADDYATPPPSLRTPSSRQNPSQAKPSPAAQQAEKPAPVKPAPVKTAPKQAEKKIDSPLSSMKPVTYFNLEDDGVPFLLETPTQPPTK